MVHEVMQPHEKRGARFFNVQRLPVVKHDAVAELVPVRFHLQHIRIHLPSPEPFGRAELNVPRVDGLKVLH